MTQTAQTAAAHGAARESAEPTFEGLARAVDEAAGAAAELAEPARQVAQDLRAAIEAAHRAALVTIVRRLRADPATRDALFELAGDPLVHMLLTLHGIIRPDPATEAKQILTALRPGLQSRGGDAELVRVSESGTARVRPIGACDGNSLAALSMREEVTQALLTGVPAITSVEMMASPSAPVLIPLTALRRRDGREQQPEAGPEPGWVKTSAVGDLPERGVTPMRLVTASGAGEDVILVRLADRMAAFGDECARQGLPLSGGLLDPAAGTLTCPWHGCCYDAMSGECMSAPGAALKQLPVRVEAGHVWVKAG